MEKEKWVQINKIQGFEEIKDCYWISNSDEDKIFNENIGRIMKIGVDKSNYKKIRLMVDGCRSVDFLCLSTIPYYREIRRSTINLMKKIEILGRN